MFARRAIGGGGPFTLPSTVTPHAEGRLSLFSGGNIYTWGMVLRAGTLHLVYSEGTSEHAGDSVAKYRTSTDLGYTWSGATTIFGSQGTGRDSGAAGVTLTPSGRIVVGLVDESTSNIFDAKGWLIYSDDGGSTWSSPYLLPITASGSEKYGLGPAIAMPDGSLILPCTRSNPTVLDTVTLRSTDDGATWSTQVVVATGAQFTEPQGTRLPDGTLILLTRQDTTAHTFRSASTDSGSTWAAASDVLTASGPPQFVQFYPNALFAFLRNNNTTFRPRWTTSWDGGLTWAALAESDTGETRELDSAGIVMLDARTILVVYSLLNTTTSSTVYRRKYVVS